MPIGRTIAEAFGFAFRHAPVIFISILLPAVATAAVMIAFRLGLSLPILTASGLIAAYLWIGAGTFLQRRFLIAGNREGPRTLFVFGRAHLWYAGFTIPFLGVWGGLIVARGWLTSVGFSLLGVSELTSQGALIVVVAAYLVFLIGVMVLWRFCLVIPAAAIGRPISPWRAWRLARGEASAFYAATWGVLIVASIAFGTAMVAAVVAFVLVFGEGDPITFQTRWVSIWTLAYACHSFVVYNVILAASFKSLVLPKPNPWA